MQAAQRRKAAGSGPLSVADIRKRKEQEQLRRELQGKRARGTPDQQAPAGHRAAAAAPTNSAAAGPAAAAAPNGTAATPTASGCTAQAQEPGAAAAAPLRQRTPLGSTSPAAEVAPPCTAPGAAANDSVPNAVTHDTARAGRECSGSLQRQAEGISHAEQDGRGTAGLAGHTRAADEEAHAKAPSTRNLTAEVAKAHGSTLDAASAAGPAEQGSLAKLLALGTGAVAQQDRSTPRRMPSAWLAEEGLLQAAVEMLERAEKQRSKCHPEVVSALHAAVSRVRLCTTS
jgi:hypothetical protein